MTDDTELLRQYAADGSEAAFAELVRRHVDLVYSASLRQMGGDHHRAQEITQMVFTDLARKAKALVRHPVLAAWLYRSTYFSALSLRRKEGRRAAYERAVAQDPVFGPDGVSDRSLPLEREEVEWERVRAVLDHAVNQLGERDREAILLRYFGERAFGEVGRCLGLTENAARMRVERALTKLQSLLARRGIMSSSAALAAVLAGQTVAAAPAGVASAAAGAALAGGAASVAALWITLMASTKIPLALTGALLIVGAGVAVVQDRADSRVTAELARLQLDNFGAGALQAENRQLAQRAEQVRGLREDNQSLGALRAQVGEQRAQAAAAKRKAAQETRTRDVASLGAGSLPAASKAGPGFRAPEPTFTAQPEYPPEMRQAGSSGEVLVDAVVASDGTVREAHPVSSSQREFEKAAVAAVSQWRFQPGQNRGKPVNAHVKIPIVFTLEPEADNWF